MTDCYCGSGKAFEQCCQPVLADPRRAAGAEDMMRARYSAYASGDVDFIVRTQHPRTRDEIDVGVVRKWSEESDWLGLEVLDRQGGEPGDAEARIEFVVRYRYKGQRQEHHERSIFETLDGVWYFVDGEPPPVRQVRRQAEKVGRNDPCPCGSGKKYKKCCGQAA